MNTWLKFFRIETPLQGLGVIMLMLCLNNTYAQTPVTLEQCYQWAEANYPLTKQLDLIQQSKSYSIDNISKGIFPQLLVSGQATYQSDVTEISIPINLPGFEAPKISKDQYRIAGELSQTLTDFPLNKAQRDLKAAEAAIQEQSIQTELYKLRERINQLYFGALLIDEQLKQSAILKDDIQRGIERVEAAIENGTAFRSNLDKLRAELLKVQQRDIELKAAKSAYMSMLGQFTGQTMYTSTPLEKPESPLREDSIRRSELQTYLLQKRASELQDKLIGMKQIPRVNIFFQGGAGRPNPVNFLEGKFSPFYLTGVRLNWSPGGLYTYKKEKMITSNDRRSIDVLQNTFLFNTQLAMKQQDADIQKYLDLIETDEMIIALRENVKQTALVQLENGVITTNDYLKEVSEADQARQNKVLHDIQLLMARYARKTTSGN